MMQPSIRYCLPIIGLLLLSIWYVRAEKLPAKSADRKTAVGNLKTLPKIQQKAFGESPLFAPKREPRMGEWLDQHQENGQTFDEYRKSKPNLVNQNRNIIYIQPIGDFPEDKNVLGEIADYSHRYFGLNTLVQKPIPVNQKITSRKNPLQGQQQLLSTDILTTLARQLPKDAYCRIGVTMTDLYPDPAWNFVFGQASLRNRVGVFSFARYDDEDPDVFLRRCLKVFTHETGHMFGMPHCVFYECMMAGSNHLKETDAAPMHLCPVCLRKLHSNKSFDLLGRYQNLKQFYQQSGLKREDTWMEKRILEFE